MRKAESATSGSRSRTDLSDMAAVARKLQQPGIYDRLVQDRRYRMRIYRRCFKANELITAMLEKGFERASVAKLDFVYDKRNPLYERLVGALD